MKELLQAKSEFRKKGVKLVADKVKSGAGGSWKFAGEDNFIKTIQKPLSECGLEYVATLDAFPELNLNIVVGTLYHIETGQFIQSKKILENPEPKLSQSGNKLYLDAEIESGKQFGYWSRILGIRLLGMSDIDPEDMNNAPSDISDAHIKLKEKLNDLIKESSDAEKLTEWILKTYKAKSIDSMPNDYLTAAITAIEGRKNASAKS
jgi:hypothetical protein